MKTADFFNLFKHHTLGKKRNFGSYRVIDGDNCQVLVRASTRYGVPNGSELIAITFTPSITLWHDANLRQIKHTVVTDIHGVKLRLNSTILDENADNLLDSGIIDVDESNNKMLIEIGDTPWLFENEDTQVDDHWTWLYNIGTKLGVRCASVTDALIAAKMQPNTISALGWTMERMPESFTPDGITPEDRITLSKPVNPMDYGFQIEHCQRETTYRRGSVGGDMLYLKSEYAGGAKGMAYKDACNVWDEALSRYSDMRPDSYENISSNDGEMVLVGGKTGVLYLKGEHRQLYDNN
ncbi:hypothetical protein LCGC14_1999840, partial [marine sediment metagenome]